MKKEIEIFKNLTLKSKPRDTQVPSMDIKDSTEQGFTAFEFITKKKGAFGPTQKECDEYYKERLFFNNYFGSGRNWLCGFFT